MINIVQIGVANTFISMIIAGFLLGYITDYLFDTMPIFLVLFGIMGFVGGLMKMQEMLVDKDIKVNKNIKK